MSCSMAWVISCQKVSLRSSLSYLLPRTSFLATSMLLSALSKQPLHACLPTRSDSGWSILILVLPIVTCFGIFTSLLRIVCYNLFPHQAVFLACKVGLPPFVLKPKAQLLRLRSQAPTLQLHRERLIHRNTSFVS